MKAHDRVIIHIDIDCFYAQVEMIRHPELKDKPLGNVGYFVCISTAGECLLKALPVKEPSSAVSVSQYFLASGLVTVLALELKHYFCPVWA